MAVFYDDVVDADRIAAIDRFVADEFSTGEWVGLESDEGTGI